MVIYLCGKSTFKEYAEPLVDFYQIVTLIQLSVKLFFWHIQVIYLDLSDEYVPKDFSCSNLNSTVSFCLCLSISSTSVPFSFPLGGIIVREVTNCFHVHSTNYSPHCFSFSVLKFEWMAFS